VRRLVRGEGRAGRSNRQRARVEARSAGVRSECRAVVVIRLTGRSIRPATNQPATSGQKHRAKEREREIGHDPEGCHRAARTRTLATRFLVTDVPIAGNLTIF
jgi:hypothetical protein